MLETITDKPWVLFAVLFAVLAVVAALSMLGGFLIGRARRPKIVNNHLFEPKPITTLPDVELVITNLALQIELADLKGLPTALLRRKLEALRATYGYSEFDEGLDAEH